MADRQLPQDLTAERALLGSLLLDPDQIDTVSLTLTALDFYQQDHQRIFQVLITLAGQRVPVDTVSLANELERLDWLEDCGGRARLARLTDEGIKSANVGHYAAILREKRALRQLIDVGSKLQLRAYRGEPSADVLKWAEASLTASQASKAGRRPESLQTSTGRILTRLESRQAHRGELTGVDTGFPTLNQLTYGWQPGHLIVLAATTSAGKSTFAINTAVAAAKGGLRVILFSLEMSRDEIEQRLLASVSGVMHSRILEGSINPIEWAQISSAIETMHGLPLAIVDDPMQTVPDIRRQCRLWQQDGGIDLVIVDYVQLVQGTAGRDANRAEEVGDIARELKLLAGELNVPVLALSQFNRGADEREPELRDLKESSGLEQHANVVCFIHPLEKMPSDPMVPVVCKFIIKKNRNGPVGRLTVTLQRTITTFLEGGEEPAKPPPVQRARKMRSPSTW